MSIHSTEEASQGSRITDCTSPLVLRVRTMPVTKAGREPLVLAAMAPLACVALTEAPFKAILGQLKGLLLI